MLQATRTLQVLLIEDNPGDVRLTQEVFKESTKDINLEVIMDGLEAIKYLNKESPYHQSITPDLILLDLNLPKLDGREILKRIKADENLRKIPVVVLSTSTAEQDVHHSYSLHANCFINKPIDFDSFFAIIKQIEDFWLSSIVLPSLTI